jgi:hypothetical protein
MEIEDIILSEVSQAQKTKSCMFSLIWGSTDPIEIQQYYKKQFRLRKSHIQEHKCKKRKLRR